MAFFLMYILIRCPHTYFYLFAQDVVAAFEVVNCTSVEVQCLVKTLSCLECYIVKYFFHQADDGHIVMVLLENLDVQGTAPSISIDNTTGCQLYLSKSSLDACITTAKSSEINVLVPGESENADLVCIFCTFCQFFLRFMHFEF